MTTYLDLIAERVVVYDGGAGTWLQEQGLTAEDFGGEALEGCNELLCVTRPDVIKAMHRAYYEAGADVAETNSFGSFAVPLAEYDLEDRVVELSEAAARLAREVADEMSADDGEPRFVAGSMGPGTKFASLGNIPYAELRDHYTEQARGLLAGGVDLFLIETQFDLLGAKAAINGCRVALREAGLPATKAESDALDAAGTPAERFVPIQVQVTMELTGRMLPGTEIGAALAALDAMNPDVVGINCATGPSEMSEHLRYLSAHCRTPISVLPNAGLPSVVDGEMHYDLSAEDFVDFQTRFVSEYGVRVVGGCCGTTPEYIRQLSAAVKGLEPAPREATFEHGATSIYSLVPFEQDASVLLIGERTNANGSKKFREAMLDEDWDTALAMARDQIGEGSHVLDVCVDYVGRDGTIDMNQIASRFATQAAAPLVLDSTEPEVMEAGLQWLGGRAILNSANLEEGDAEGTRLDRVFRLAKEYGAAVICLCIDEEGQARDIEWKMRVAHRIHDLAVERYGLEPQDLIFDALTFPLTTGDEDLRGDAMATIEAIRRIKTELPGVFTTLGLSNVSFGLNPAARHVLNSVFLAECQAAGMDSAIVHAGKIIPLARIPEAQREVCLDLIYDRRNGAGSALPVLRTLAADAVELPEIAEGEEAPEIAPEVLAANGAAKALSEVANDGNGYDPLTALLALFEGVSAAGGSAKEDRSDWPVEERLHHRIIDGDRDGLTDDLDEAMGAGIAPLDIINEHLLGGMRVVGELFGAGEMQLPFVLQSAETMKAAVAHLEPHMDKADTAESKGRVVLATVKGDVHDIGKNLVDIILTNNGYEVHNIGIKVGIAEMIEKATEVGAHAIGMSGLLVKSTLIMRDNLEELNDRGLAGDTPIMLGGAALTRTYVEKDLREVYDGRLFYGKDAFEGLAVMDRLGAIRTGDEADDPEWGCVPVERQMAERKSERLAKVDPATLPSRSPDVVTDNPVFVPPFLGSKVVKGLSIDEISGWINETALFRNQWQYRPETLSSGEKETDAQFKERMRPLLRERLAQAKADDLLVPQVVYGYFPANGDGTDLVIWTDESRTTERCRFHYPRQREEPYLAIPDFFRSVDSGEADYAAFQIVTMGARVSEKAAELFAADAYADYMLTHGLGVEMAEALAEMWHRRVREEWGFADEDPEWGAGSPHPEALMGLFRQKYRSGRYSWGYPACPDLEDNLTVMDLLEGERIGLECSEDTGFQYQPEQTTSAIICHHPRAKYFIA